MRLLIAFSLALLMLPLSGCAKKKKDDSPTSAESNSSNESNAANMTGNSGTPMPAGGHGGDSGHGSGMPVDNTIPPMPDGTMPDGTVADASASQNSQIFTPGTQGAAGHGQVNTSTASPGGHGGNGVIPGTQGAAGHGQVNTSTTSPGGHGGNGVIPGTQGAAGPGQVNTSTVSPGGHGGNGVIPGTQGAAGPGQVNTSTVSPGGHGSNGVIPGTQGAAGPGQVNTSTVSPGGNAAKTPASSGHDDGSGMPVANASEIPGTGMPTTSADPTMETPGTQQSAEGGQQNANSRKPTDIRGVKEGTAEYAAVSLILKIAYGESDGLKSLISEDARDAKQLLQSLRADDPAKALAEAKEVIGQVQFVNSRPDDRDTVISFRNKNEKILQFYVRKVQGEYIVRELRVREATTPNPRSRRE